MKRFISWAVLALSLTAMPALGAVPQIISYQGVVTDDSGNLISPGVYQIKFNIYNDPVLGVPGVLGVNTLWTEIQPLSVTLGGFSTQFPSPSTVVTNPVALPFDTQYYLGISVGVDGEMSPRTPLDASPYSVTSKSLEDGTASAPPIKMMTLTGTTAATDGGTIYIPMPIATDKLVSVAVLVRYHPDGWLPPNYTKDPCFEFEWYVFGGYLYVNNMLGNSSCVLSKAFTVLVAYRQ